MNSRARAPLASLVLVLLTAAACDRGESKSEAKPEVKSEPTPDEPPAEQEAVEPPAEPPAEPAPGPTRPEGYPQDFPLLADGVRDPGYPPAPSPDGLRAFLYVFSKREPADVGGEITKAAEPVGWNCIAMSDPNKWVCLRDVKQIAVHAKPHPEGGTALFVSELPDATTP